VSNRFPRQTDPNLTADTSRTVDFPKLELRDFWRHFRCLRNRVRQVLPLPYASACAVPRSIHSIRRIRRPAGCEPPPPMLILGRPAFTPHCGTQTGIGTGFTIMSWDEVTILVEQAQRGERAAYGELVKRFENAIFAIALSKVHDAGEAQELTQEVFVHAMRKLPQLRDARCFAGWLRQITVRMAINRLTRNGLAHGSDSTMLDTVAARTDSPLEELERSEARRQIHEGLSQLKKLDRETLESFYIRARSNGGCTSPDRG
jgi:RNA polymerase sigma-70 factor (ECF subfamily)